MKLKIAIACGGTGGHLFPGIAVSNALKARSHETQLLVSSKSIDKTALQGAGDQDSRILSTRGFPGWKSPQLFSFLGCLWKSWRECQGYFQAFQPDAVLGMGGFTSVVPLLLGRLQNRATLIHESNAIPGKVTRLLSKRVSKVLLGFDSCQRFLPGASCVVTGTPIRQGWQQPQDRAQVAQTLGLDPQKKTILIMGGSQGAHAINRAITQALSLCRELRSSIQFLHLTGLSDSEWVAQAYAQEQWTAWVQPFSSQMEDLYGLADFVIARSGASSLTETSALGLPSLLVPYPHAADNHQKWNADIFQKQGAAHIVLESELTPERIKETFLFVVEQEDTCHQMGQAARELARIDAAEAVAKEVEACCQN